MTDGITAVVRNPADGEPLTVEFSEAPQIVNALNALLPMQYDEIELEYSDKEISSVTYLLKAVPVSTLELYYHDGNLVRIVKK